MAKKTPDAPGQCLIHFKGEEMGSLTQFTETSFKKVLESHELWLTLDGEQQEIAAKSNGILKGIQSTEEMSIKGFYYHRNCYAQFTNVTYIKRAQARCSKRQENENDENVPAQKILRSSTKTSSVKSRNQAILPPVCIICNQEKGYFTEIVSTFFFILFLAFCASLVPRRFFVRKNTLPFSVVYRGQRPRIRAHWMSGSLWLVISNHLFLV